MGYSSPGARLETLRKRGNSGKNDGEPTRSTMSSQISVKGLPLATGVLGGS